MDTTYVNFSKVFDSVSNNILVSEFRHYGLDGWTARWIKTDWRVGLRGEWLMGCTLPRVRLGLTGFTAKALECPGRQHAACASGVCPASKGG